MIRYILVILSLLLLSSCENTDVLVMTDAAADAVSAITLTDEEVSRLARQAAKVSDSRNKVAESGTAYETRLKKLVAGYSEIDGNKFNYKVYLINDVNAFAMADGTIRVNSGLMDLMEDEELLFVIGHEIGHVIKEHSRKKVVMAYASSALRKGLASQDNEIGQIARSVVGAFAQQITNAQFSQHEERQADQYGVAFLKAGNYEPNAAVSALEKLADLAAREHTFLSSHPDPEARARTILQGGDGESEEQGSILGTLLEYGKKIVVWLFVLIRSLIDWLLSFLTTS